MGVRASIIICTYNRASLLPGLFEAFLEQTIPVSEFELILVNDGSTDQTEEVARQIKKRLPNLIYIQFDENQGLARAANRGIEAANTDILLFTDDDCIPEPDWVEKMIKFVSVSPIVGGQILTKKSPYLTLARNIAEYHPLLLRNTPGDMSIIAGANMGFQRKIFSEIGKFLPGCTTPDMELLLRILSAGYQIKFEPSCKITHFPVPKTLIQSCIYEASRSFSTIQLRKKYKKLLQTPFVLESAFLLVALSPFLALYKACQVFLSNTKLFIYLYTFPVVFLLKIAWCIGASKGIIWLKRSGTKSAER